MATPILTTKLYVPLSRPKLVIRPRLIEHLNAGRLGTAGVTLISAPAGFGKTTVVSEWLTASEPGKPRVRVAWLSLDAGDSDPTRFLTYFILALQTISAGLGDGLLGALQAPQPPPVESILTGLINEIASLSDNFVLVLDDYHVIESQPVDLALTFLVEHLPRQIHLVIITREDPNLPLARLRARGQLTELRAADLRFTLPEADGFLNRVMGFDLSAENIRALESRTEGWIAGLQLAAISMQGHQNPSGFVKTFTGSHRFVLDYLAEEVLQQQPEGIQDFLLRTSILDRMCGPLCEAVLGDAVTSGQATLEYIENANLFIVPLDNERRWYRYHHLFADLLRQRLHQHLAATTANAVGQVNELHIRASQWYEDNDLDLEAFYHAAAGNDIERTERLIEGKGILLHYRDVVTAVLAWMESLPSQVLDARPSLWWRYGALLLVNGQTTGVEEKLRAAEVALAAAAQQRGGRGNEPDDANRYLVGRIASARATLALTRYDVEGMISQAERALEYLPADNLSYRATANWTLGFANFMLADRAAARRAYTEAIALSEASGNTFTTILATIGLGGIQELDNQLYEAAETYQRVLHIAGDQPLQIIYEAHIGLARVLYEWNQLDAAEQHGQQGLWLARQYDKVIDRYIICEVFLARLKMARGDLDGAQTMLAESGQTARQKNFIYRLPEVAAAQVQVLLRQGNVEAAAQLAQFYELPLAKARVFLAQGDPATALAELRPFRQKAEAKSLPDERLAAMILQILALKALGQLEQALQGLAEALALAEPGGFVRTFVDEGPVMAELLSEAMATGIKPHYVAKILAVLEAERPQHDEKTMPRPAPHAQNLEEPLSERELEILQLIDQGLSNREISERLFLALSTVKGHNQKIFDKLQVQSRTEALAQARVLGLLKS